MNDPSSPVRPDIVTAEDRAFHYRVNWRCDDSLGIHWRLSWLTQNGAFLADFGLSSSDPMKCVATSVRDTIPAPRWRACREILRELETAKDLVSGPAEERPLLPRLEAREPGFPREVYEIMIELCRKTLAALAVPRDKPVVASIAAVSDPEPIGFNELVDACAQNWDQVVAVLAAKERPPG